MQNVSKVLSLSAINVLPNLASHLGKYALLSIIIVQLTESARSHGALLRHFGLSSTRLATLSGLGVVALAGPDLSAFSTS